MSKEQGIDAARVDVEDVGEVKRLGQGIACAR
jgi:hypothetical protein